jgi:hypothetical protein
MIVPYSHVIAVPARQITANYKLMLGLALQMASLKDKRVAVVAMPEWLA